MEVTELRKEIHDLINQADERFLKMVYAMGKEYQNSTIVGYDSEGLPLTQDDLRSNAKAASLRVKSGDFLTQEEVERDMDNW